MAPTNTYLRSAGNPLLQKAIPFQQPPRNYYSRPFRPIRSYSSSNESAKPRPYSSPPKTKPLVGTRTRVPSPGNLPNVKPPPNANPKSGGVYAPYWRISLGVVICGALIYSMVPLLPPIFMPKLTYMHASSPPPYSSSRPPLPPETPSQSANPA